MHTLMRRTGSKTAGDVAHVASEPRPGLRGGRGLAAALALAMAGCGAGSGGAARGRELFTTCAACHGASGQGDRALDAPNIAGLPQWYVEAQLLQFQKGYRGAVPADTAGRRMAASTQTLQGADDVAAVAAYVSGLRARRPPATLEGGDPVRGKVAYQVCASCHGADGEGKLDVPPVVTQADWYVLASLRRYKAGWRGTNQGDLQASRMRAVMIPVDSAAVADVVAYISTLR
jgi:cytochrome c oxidase subunit II